MNREGGIQNANLIKRGPYFYILMGTERINDISERSRMQFRGLRYDRDPAAYLMPISGETHGYAFNPQSNSPIVQMSTPSIRIVPETGSIILNSANNNDDLPAPVRPQTPVDALNQQMICRLNVPIAYFFPRTL